MTERGGRLVFGFHVRTIVRILTKVPWCVRKDCSHSRSVPLELEESPVVPLCARYHHLVFVQNAPPSSRMSQLPRRPPLPHHKRGPTTNPHSTYNNPLLLSLSIGGGALKETLTHLIGAKGFDIVRQNALDALSKAGTGAAIESHENEHCT